MTEPKVQPENRSNLFNVFGERLYAYHELSLRMHEQDDYRTTDIDNALTEMEFEILQYFGLPLHAQVFAELLQFFGSQDPIDDEDIELLLAQLKGRAEKYTKAQAMGAEAVLNEGRQLHESAFEVLPYVDIDLSLYNIFLYETLLYARDYDTADILNEMNAAASAPGEIIMAIASDELFSGSFDEAAEAAGLRYWNDYVENAWVGKHTPGKKDLRSLDHVREYGRQEDFPETLLTSGCYISAVKMESFAMPAVAVEMATDYEEDWLNMVVYMPFIDFLALLKKATNQSVAAMLRAIFVDQVDNQDLERSDIDIRQAYGTYLFCPDVEIELVHTEIKSEEGQVTHHNYYETFDFSDYLSEADQASE